MMRRLFLGMIACLATSLFGCGGGNAPPASIQAPPTPPAATSEDVLPRVEFDTSEGKVIVELLENESPVTVENFLLNYVEQGHYNGSLIHYVSESMLLGGGFGEDRKPTIVFSPIVNESDNQLSNVRGTLSMSRDPDQAGSATSQFFFNLEDNVGLDHEAKGEGSGGNGYCVFGRVVGGLEVLDQIAKKDVHEIDNFVNFPVDPVLIRSARRLP